jgi:hypothetical protein
LAGRDTFDMFTDLDGNSGTRIAERNLLMEPCLSRADGPGYALAPCLLDQLPNQIRPGARL